MISGADEQELELANARANIIMMLDNTCYYESWLIIDTYIEKLEEENQQLKDKLYKKQDTLNKIIDYVDCPKFNENFESIANENNARKEILEIIKGINKE